MTDAEILKEMRETLESHSRQTMTFFSGEIDSVRHEVKGIREEFKAMNGRLRDVCQWKAEQEGAIKVKEKWGAKHIAIAAVLVAIISVAVNFFK